MRMLSTASRNHTLLKTHKTGTLKNGGTEDEPVSGGYYKARMPTTHETTLPQIESAAPTAPVKAALDVA